MCHIVAFRNLTHLQPMRCPQSVRSPVPHTAPTHLLLACELGRLLARAVLAEAAQGLGLLHDVGELLLERRVARHQLLENAQSQRSDPRSVRKQRRNAQGQQRRSTRGEKCGEGRTFFEAFSSLSALSSFLARSSVTPMVVLAVASSSSAWSSCLRVDSRSSVSFCGP